MLPHRLVVAQSLRFDATHDPLRLFHEVIELHVGPHVEFTKPLEELGEVGDRRIAEDFGLAVVAAADPLGQMRHQPRQFFEEGGLSELYGFVKPCGHALRLLPIQVRAELL